MMNAIKKVLLVLSMMALSFQVASAATQTVPLKVRHVTVPTRTSSSLTITWKAQTGVDAYQLRLMETNGKLLKKLTGTANTVVLTGLQANHAYKIRVRAQVGSVVGMYSRAIVSKTDPEVTTTVQPPVMHAVSIVDFSFSPASLTILAGDSVKWTNTGSAEHTVTATDGAFSSDTLASGQTYTHQFTAKGTYTYYCKIHGAAMMSGTITVQ